MDETRARLKDLDPLVRSEALDALLTAHRSGQVEVQPPGDLVNMHCHTIFSYNGYGHSPTSLAWLAKESGWYAVGMVDFDVLDAVGECLESCDRVQVRGAVGLETRAWLADFARYEINSPGEPGILYHVGAGFVSAAAPAGAAAVLAQMRQGAAQRNRDMVARINAHLDPVTIDYDRDVLPLTPAGNATERHILIAYDIAARARVPEREQLVDFWAHKLGMDRAKVAPALGETPTPSELVRSRLMKRGGVGYVQPGAESFPPLHVVNEAIIACGALPLYAYLDGASEGEQRLAELLELQIRQGVAGINIVPDRNWNFPDPSVRASKVHALYEAVELARALDLPIIVGTEMNKAGQRLVDDFDAEPLRPLRAEFAAGARFVYGHTVMQRALGLGYQSAWAERHLPTRRDRNAFYAEVGGLVAPGRDGLRRLGAVETTLRPAQITARLRE